MPAIRVRTAVAADATSIAMLVGQLGYPTATNEAVARLAQLERHRHATARLADVDGEVIGLATGHLFPSIHSARKYFGALYEL